MQYDWNVAAATLTSNYCAVRIADCVWIPGALQHARRLGEGEDEKRSGLGGSTGTTLPYKAEVDRVAEAPAVV